MPDETQSSPEIPVEVEVPAAEAPVPEAGAVAPAEPSAEERIAALEREKKETYDRLLRSAADLDNFRKRARKDADEARARGREEILREVLPGIDDLERALAHAEGNAVGGGGVVDGVKLVLRKLTGALERFEIKSFTSLGQAFDPSRHEAIAQVPTAEYPPGTVCSEMQKGYMMGSRLLRPAMVAVAKAPPAPESPAAPTEPSA
jgi:molecular chaperone GrpE